MEAVIECIRGTREKYETAPDGSLVLDRMLKRKWIANYGYVPGTLQADGDELDTYVIAKAKRGDILQVLPLCMIYCIDGGKTDNKLICAGITARGNIKAAVKRIARFVKRYKKGCMVIGITWRESNIRYEIAKCKAYRNLFGGKTCQF